MWGVGRSSVSPQLVAARFVFSKKVEDLKLWEMSIRRDKGLVGDSPNRSLSMTLCEPTILMEVLYNSTE